MVDIIHPGALESQAQMLEEIDEMRQQLRKQVQRLRELRIKKVEEPGSYLSLIIPIATDSRLTDAFYGVEDMDLHNVDVMTDASMAPTAFTRYTVAPSAMSKTSSKSVIALMLWFMYLLTSFLQTELTLKEKARTQSWIWTQRNCGRRRVLAEIGDKTNH